MSLPTLSILIGKEKGVSPKGNTLFYVFDSKNLGLPRKDRSFVRPRLPVPQSGRASPIHRKNRRNNPTTKKPPRRIPTVETKRKLKRRSKIHMLVPPVKRRPVVRREMLESFHRIAISIMPAIPDRRNRQRPVPQTSMLHVAI